MLLSWVLLLHPLLDCILLNQLANQLKFFYNIKQFSKNKCKILTIPSLFVVLISDLDNFFSIFFAHIEMFKSVYFKIFWI